MTCSVIYDFSNLPASKIPSGTGTQAASGPVKGKRNRQEILLGGLSRGHLGYSSPVAEIGFLQNRPVGQLSELRFDKLGKANQTYEGLHVTY